MSERYKEVPKILSNTSKKAEANRTGKDRIPITAGKKKAQIVNGSLEKDIPFVRRVVEVVMSLIPPNKEEAIKKVIEINQRVIPIPDPGMACSKADKGGYTTQPPPAGPVLRKREINMITPDTKKNQ